MKFLTKDWASKYEIARFIVGLNEIEQEKQVTELESLCKKNFLDYLYLDEDMKKVLTDSSLFERLYSEKLKRNAKLVDGISKNVLGKLEKVDILSLGFATKKDKDSLTTYLNQLIAEIEDLSLSARKVTENASKHLSKPFDLDEVVGELVYNEYAKGKNYFIEIGGRLLSVKNYKIIQRDDFKIYDFQEDNPLTCWTCIKAVELHYDEENGFEVHLLILNGDENENTKNLYFTLLGTDVTLI